jgi:hypothetical protein
MLTGDMDEIAGDGNWFIAGDEDIDGLCALHPLVQEWFSYCAKSVFDETGQRGAVVFEIGSDPRESSYLPGGKVFESGNEAIDDKVSEYDPSTEYVGVAIDPLTNDYEVFISNLEFPLMD